MHGYKDGESLVNQYLVVVWFYIIIIPWEHYPSDHSLRTKEV